MKKMITASLAGTLAALFLNSCAGFGTDTNIGNTTNVYNIGNGGNAGSVKQDEAPLPERTAPGKKQATSKKRVQAESKKVIILSDQRDMLRVRLASSANDPGEKMFAARLNSGITGATGLDEVKIVSGKNTDLIMQIQPRLILIDKAGEYYRLNGEVSVSIKDSALRRTFNSKIFSVTGTRTLGKEAAIRKLSNAVQREVTSWFRKTVNHISEKELDAAILKIKLPGNVRNVKRDNSNIHIISNYLAKLGGVVSYGYRGMDTGSGTCEFRILYFRDKYPGGIANAASILLDSAAELK